MGASFGTNGRLEKSNTQYYYGATVLALYANGDIIIGGQVSRTGLFYDSFFLMRFYPNGSPDSSFGVNGLVTTAFYLDGQQVHANPNLHNTSAG